jgi:Domain of unknown function (DUF4157)
MLLASESHRRIEAFLRAHLRSETLRLPPVFIYCGRWSRYLTSAFSILAITFGQRIFIAANAVSRDDSGRLVVSARLIAHEAVHVVQYQQAGFIGFLFSYAREYWRALQGQRQGLGKAARLAAYFAIKQECEAYEAENAYAGWLAQEMMNEEKNAASLMHHEKDLSA